MIKNKANAGSNDIIVSTAYLFIDAFNPRPHIPGLVPFFFTDLFVLDTSDDTVNRDGHSLSTLVLVCGGIRAIEDRN